MDEMLNIQNGSFQARIQLDGLPSLPITRVKKLFRLMLQTPRKNAETLALLDRALPERVQEMKEHWRMASEAHIRGRKYIADPKRRDSATPTLVRHNNTLMAAVKQTKAQYDHWQKIHQSYITIKGD